MRVTRPGVATVVLRVPEERLQDALDAAWRAFGDAAGAVFPPFPVSTSIVPERPRRR